MDRLDESSEGLDQVFARLYQELREVSARVMRHERTGHTLRPTALLHETFLKLKRSEELSWHDDAHFKAIVVRNMERILASYARDKQAQKRRPVDPQSDERVHEDAHSAATIVDLHRALDSLPCRHRDGDYYRRLILWKDVFGFTQQEVGLAVGCAERTVRDHLALARLCLAQALGLG